MSTFYKKITLLFHLFLIVSCSSIYYSGMEKLGYEKRDLMVSRIKAAQDTQKETQQQFSSALERFRSAVDFKGGALEKVYDQLSNEHEKTQHKVEELTRRIAKIEDVANALFREWETELSQYENQSLREKSQQRLIDTKQRYKPMIEAMHRAKNSAAPILKAFNDQVLYLKHNLNAKAIGAIRGELSSVEGDVANLIANMQVSMSEAGKFIEEIEQ